MSSCCVPTGSIKEHCTSVTIFTMEITALCDRINATLNIACRSCRKASLFRAPIST